MKSKKIFLELEEEEAITIGLMRLTQKTPNYEVFFHLNRLNSFQFFRTDDLRDGEFSFAKFEVYLAETKTRYFVLANKSAPQKQKTTYELFSQTEEIKFLLPKNQDVEYLIYAKDSIPDFSLFLLPENILQPIQEFSLVPQNELYKLIQYYE